MKKLDFLLHETAAQCPDRLAVRYRDCCLSYGQMVAVLDALGKQIGSVAGKRIVLLLPDGMPAYLCHLHFFLSGAAVVPVSVQTGTARLMTLCEKVQPHFVLTNSVLRARHATALADIPCLIIKSNAPQAPCVFDFESLGPEVPVPTAGQTTETQPEDIRLIVFTSGSTGEPKGVCLSEENIIAAAGMNVSFLSLSPLRKSLITLPLYDYYGFIQIYSHILAGGGLILGESLVLPDQIFRRIQEERVTDLVLVPHTLREILKVCAGESRAAIRSLQYMTSSSDALTPELLRQAFEVNPQLKIYNIYGLTEAGRACYRRIEASSPPSNSIGRAAPGVEIWIDDTGGEPGEIIIKGPNVMRGYFQGIQGNRITFRPSPEMRTGDLGYYDDRGEIVLVGRRDHMFNIKGAKIHPAEIERIALQAAGVADALARTDADASGEVAIYLDVVPTDGTFDLEAVRAHLRRNLSPAFFPREINVVSSLKRTELGSKVIRRQVPA